MPEITEVLSIEPDLTEEDGTIHYVATVIMDRADVRFYGREDPPEVIPGQVSCAFEVEPGGTPPPLNGTFHEQAQFLQGLELEWRLDDPEFSSLFDWD